ncbi:MAG TPA: helix-turn-helix domain-containing protein [Polyangia bacterium]|nr:helix-turn-helix domain-containing protein [Polyangia bacterium]
MPKKPAAKTALFVRLPATAAARLDRAAEALRIAKKDLITGLVSTYVDPDSRRGLDALGALATRRAAGSPSPRVAGGAGTLGSYSFQAYEPPEIMDAAQAGDFLQIEESAVIELAEARKIPGRKLGSAWRFSRAALVTWLSSPEGR